MPLFIVVFVVGSIIDGPSFALAGMALLASFALPLCIMLCVGLVVTVADLFTGKGGAQ